ncbi:hypothetical protein GCM10027046_38810 [Uliginosibacterium flavum]
MLAVALCSALLGIVFNAHQRSQQNTGKLVTNQFLSSTLHDATGSPQALSRWAGKPLLINFWAPWCAPCVEEMPELAALQTELGAEHIQFIGIGLDSQESIRKFADRFEISYPLYVAGMHGAELSAQFGNRSGGLPFTALIGQDGRIVKTWLGRLNMPELRKDLAACLSSASPC